MVCAHTRRTCSARSRTSQKVHKSPMCAIFTLHFEVPLWFDSVRRRLDCAAGSYWSYCTLTNPATLSLSLSLLDWARPLFRSLHRTHQHRWLAVVRSSGGYIPANVTEWIQEWILGNIHSTANCTPSALCGRRSKSSLERLPGVLRQCHNRHCSTHTHYQEWHSITNCDSQWMP